MFEKIFRGSKKLITSPQSSILSAAMVIMLMSVVSAAFGIIRHRVLLAFFEEETYALYLAAFRLPDMVFEVFAFGMFSAAFIPVFTKLLKDDERVAWDVAARVMNIALFIFAFFALIFGIFAPQFYALVTPTFNEVEAMRVVQLARILFIAQGFFVISYVLSGVLESLRRFLVPAISPLFYNLGIILGTIFLAPQLGLLAPALGAVIGAGAHMLIQLPVAIHFGFRFRRVFRPTPQVSKIGKLAGPRLLELGILQILKTAELYFASIISVVSYTYLYLANSLQVVPLSLFAVSISKASLPTLTRQEDNPHEFRKIFLTTLYQMMFIIIPVSAFIIVLRIPIVRLIFGTNIFDWEATVQTGLVLTAFAVGVPFQAGLTLLSRAFYARHDTKTPVLLAIFDVVVTIVLNIIFVLILRWPVWSIALANTIAGIISFSLLFTLLSRKTGNGTYFSFLPIAKIVTAATLAGSSMFFLLKLFDRSVWVKRLSFLSGIDTENSLVFRHFVLDTRYTFNLLVLTFFVSLIGGAVYLLTVYLLRSEELFALIEALRRRKRALSQKESEAVVTHAQSDTTPL